MAQRTNFSIKRKSIFIFFFTSAMFGSQLEAAPGRSVDLSKGESRVEFLAVGKPSAIRIRGKGGPLSGRVIIGGDSVTGVVGIDLNSFDTGIGLRNTHMKEKYLQTGQFPRAELVIKRIAGIVGFMDSGKKLENIDFDGTLKLHGVEKPVVGKVTIAHDGKSVDGSARFKLKISDFGVEVPSYAGITVADEVEVETFFKAPAEVKQ